MRTSEQFSRRQSGKKCLRFAACSARGVQPTASNHVRVLHSSDERKQRDGGRVIERITFVEATLECWETNNCHSGKTIRGFAADSGNIIKSPTLLSERFLLFNGKLEINKE